MGDLLADLENWMRAFSQDYTVEPMYRMDAKEFIKKFDERAKKQAEMRANAEELHRIGGRLIARANREAQNESELD